MESLPKAQVLNWDVYGYLECNTKVHKHRRCVGNRVYIAPCRSLARDPNRYRYTILFPYEEDPLTEGLSWAIEVPLGRWRTVGWWVEEASVMHETSRYWYYVFANLSVEEDESAGVPSGAGVEEQAIENEDAQEKLEEVDATHPRKRKAMANKRRLREISNETQAKDCQATTTDDPNLQSEAKLSGQPKEAATDSRKTQERHRITAQPNKGSESDLDHLENMLGALTIAKPISADQVALLKQYCLENCVEEASRLLAQSDHPTKLIDGLPRDVQFRGGRIVDPVMVQVCAKGYREIVDLLFSYRPQLNTCSRLGAMALIAAAKHGHFEIALSLIGAGAGVNDKGSSLLEVARAAVASQEPQPTSSDTLESSKRISGCLTQRLALGRLEDIVRDQELRRVRKYASARYEVLAEAHQRSLIENLFLTKSFERDAAVISAIPKLANVPTRHDAKVVACLIRGAAWRNIYAVSGYNPGPYQECGNKDGALDRKEWTNHVFSLAQMIGHELAACECDGNKRPGSFFACHAEKQLLAKFIWDHTVAWRNRDPFSSNVLFLAQCQPPSLRRLQADIIIWCKKYLVKLCEDCELFFQTAAIKFGLDIRLHEAFGECVSHTWRFKRDSTDQRPDSEIGLSFR